MRILLDTHIFLWAINDDPNLIKSARDMILEATEVYISSASIWEAAIKIGLKKLKGNINEIRGATTESGFLELPISTKHAAGIVELPNIHQDPFDRILLSQAIAEPLRLITADKILAKYSELVRIIL